MSRRKRPRSKPPDQRSRKTPAQTKPSPDSAQPAQPARPPAPPAGGIQIQWPPPEPPLNEEVIEQVQLPDAWVPIPLGELLRRLEQERCDPAPRRDRVVMLITGAAALLAGLAAGWQWFALRMLGAAVLGPSPGTTTLLAVVALAGAAVGPWLPVRFLPSIVRLIEQIRKRSVRTDNEESAGTASWLHRVFHQRDETLFWAAAAVLSAAAGAEVLVMLSLIGWAARSYEWMLERFFWTDATLAAMEWFGAAVIVAPVWILNSLVATCMILATTRRASLRQSVMSTAAAWTLGFGTAGAAHQMLTDAGVSGDQQAMLGIVPMFGVAMLLCILAHRAGRQNDPLAHSAPPAVKSTIADSRCVRWSLPAWSIGVGLAGMGWSACWQYAPRPVPWLSGLGVALLAFSLTAGLALCCGVLRGHIAKAPGCGMAIWATGLGTGVAATLISYSAAGWSAVLQIMFLAIPAGFTLCQVQTAWMALVLGRGQALARMMLVLLGGLAGALVMGRWILLPTIGPAGVAAAGALLMLTFGGLAQIYAEDASSRSHHLRLGLIFASLAAGIAVFPQNVRQWSGQARGVSGNHGRVDTWWLARHAPAGARRFALIGADLEPGARSPIPWDATPLISVSLTYAVSSSSIISGPRDRRALFNDAWRALQLGRREYDLIYQYGPLSSAGERYAGYSLEWWTLLVRHRAAGGRVIVDIPVAGLNPQAMRIVAATFEQAMDEPCVWASMRTPGGPVLRLQTGDIASNTLETGSAENWQHVHTLINNYPVTFHSLRRDQITPMLTKSNVPGKDPYLP